MSHSHDGSLHDRRNHHFTRTRFRHLTPTIAPPNPAHYLPVSELVLPFAGTPVRTNRDGGCVLAAVLEVGSGVLEA